MNYAIGTVVALVSNELSAPIGSLAVVTSHHKRYHDMINVTFIRTGTEDGAIATNDGGYLTRRFVPVHVSVTAPDLESNDPKPVKIHHINYELLQRPAKPRCAPRTMNKQDRQVLGYMKRGHSISSIEAKQFWNVDGLPQRIHTLRSNGYKITTKHRVDAVGVRFAEYSLTK